MISRGTRNEENFIRPDGIVRVFITFKTCRPPDRRNGKELVQVFKTPMVR